MKMKRILAAILFAAVVLTNVTVNGIGSVTAYADDVTETESKEDYIKQLIQYYQNDQEDAAEDISRVLEEF